MTVKERKMDLRRIESNVKNITWKFRDAKQLEYYYPEMDSTKKVQCPEDVFNMFSKMYKNETRELFCVLWLSTCNKVIGFEIVSIGTLNSSTVHPREVFRSAVVSSCANIILMHNHPSGNPEPSLEDVQLTKVMIRIGWLLDIKVFDHIIIAGDQFVSMSGRHMIDTTTRPSLLEQ